MIEPASLMPIAEDGEENNCEEVMTASSQTDLKDIPLQNPKMIFFVDGSSTRTVDGSLLSSGYVVCSESDILESGELPRHYSTQQAELCALIAACNLPEDKSVIIYTDSQYA